jgi:hypothetical protein
MARSRFNGPVEPMTLSNMRENGVRSLAVQCHQCRHEVIVNVDHLPGDLTVPSFGPRMVCTKCGTIGADVRPNWREGAVKTSATASAPSMDDAERMEHVGVSLTLFPKSRSVPVSAPPIPPSRSGPS